jgi:hypothetical protein
LARTKRDTECPAGKAASAAASAEDVIVLLVRTIAPPEEPLSTEHCFVVLSAGFQKSGPPANVVVLSGSLQTQLAPSSVQRCSSA